MRRHKADIGRAAAGALLLLVAVAAVRPVQARTYDRLMRELGDLPHRLAGTPSFALAADAVERELSAAGLEVHRQTFDTLIPETLECRLTVDGRDIGPLFPLGPNGVAPTTAGDAVLEGPLIWLGEGRIEDMDGWDVEGALVLMRFGSPNMDLAFSQGAKAVLLVGDARADQWSAAAHFTALPINQPRAFVPREVAEREGWIGMTEPRRAELRLRTVWKDVKAVNLWTVIPGREGAHFRLGQEEMIVLSAALDTFGLVPDFSPDRRRLANAALLVEVAASLASARPERTILIAFLGSHYAAQDGARHLYYAADKAEVGGWNVDPLDLRADRYREEIRILDSQLERLASPDFLTERHPEQFALQQMVRRRLERWVNAINYELREWFLLERELDLAGDRTEELAALRERIETREQEKSVWNNMRRDLSRRQMDPADEAFARVVDLIREELHLRREEVRSLLDHNQSFEVLSSRFAGRSVVGHYGLNFAATNAPWYLCMQGDSRNLRPEQVTPGAFLANLEAIRNTVRAVVETGAEGPPLLEDATRAVYSPYALSFHLETTTATAIPTSLGIPGYALMSAGDPLGGDGLPKFADVDLSALSAYLARLFLALADAPELSQRPALRRFPFDTSLTYRLLAGNRYHGFQVQDYAMGSSEVDGPAHNAVALNFGGPWLALPPLPGQFRIAMGRVNRQGYFFIPLCRELNWRGGFGFDDSGRVIRFPVAQTRTHPEAGRLFYGFGGGLVQSFMPRIQGIFGVESTRMINAMNDSAERQSYIQESITHSAIYHGRDVSFKYLGASGVMILNATSEQPLGQGVVIGDPPVYRLNAVQQSAWDYAVLNQSRLRALRERNIINDALESAQADVEEHLEAAAQYRTERRHALALAREVVALALGLRIYTPLRGVTDDLVQAVVYLMILSIPFAFAMERLLFGCTSIYHQVGAFAAFFIATFIVLYFVHPAFALASAPLIIFLAFVIILMSSIVIYLVMSKFKHELRAIQGLASKAHGTSGRASVTGAAVMIGISGLRKRPIKTLLTSITVVLLTFTILVFASFTSRMDVVETHLGRGHGPERIEIHRFSFLRIPDLLMDAIQTLHADRFEGFRRNGLFSDPASPLRWMKPSLILYAPALQATTRLDGVLGLEAGELQRNEALRGLLPGPLFDEATGLPVMYLSETIADRFDADDEGVHIALSPGTRVRLHGREFLFGGVFDRGRMHDAANLDQTRIVPPDFQATATEQNIHGTGDRQEQELERIDVHSFIWTSPDSLAVAPFSALEPLDATANFLTLYPVGEQDVDAVAQEIARVFDGPIFALSADGVRQFFFTRAVTGSGFGEILVPLLLGGLIIFSSLMGSIVDREREIFTYSALGLSPRDVGMLFFAESAVYAVVGGMGGYLISQLVAQLLRALATFGWFDAPEMNFSSMTAVLTILLVMATVMLSTLYPAAKAGKSANPGVARRWKMPDPDGGHLRFIFPFTVSESDLAGILSFIAEHFENHGDASIGSFAAKQIELFRAPDVEGGRPRMGISATISLAPFDLGIFQHFRISSQPSEIPGIDEVVVELEKISGAPASWVRGNRVFIADLRNQFLLWRSLDVETMETYREKTETIFGEKPIHG